MSPRRAAIALLLSFSALAGPSEAHTGAQSYCSAHTVAGGLDVELTVPSTLVARQAEPREDVAGHVRVTTPAGECTLTTRGPSASAQPQMQTFELAFACPDGPLTFSTDYGMLVDRSAQVVCSIDGRAHIFRDGALDYFVGEPPSLLQQLLSFVRLGTLHVLGGIDHLLFVLSLLLGAASAAAQQARRTLRRVAGIVTGFTLGHSVTLLLAALGVVKLPAALTESLIALSIVIVAVHNLFESNPRGRAVVSAGFGLVHGFGFASALAAVGLPRRAAVASLLAFNVGIELAQLGVVLLAFPALMWAARRPWFRARVLVPACVSIALLATVWLVKRAFGLSAWPWLGT